MASWFPDDVELSSLCRFNADSGKKFGKKDKIVIFFTCVNEFLEEMHSPTSSTMLRRGTPDLVKVWTKLVFAHALCVLGVLCGSAIFQPTIAPTHLPNSNTKTARISMPLGSSTSHSDGRNRAHDPAPEGILHQRTNKPPLPAVRPITHLAP